MSDLTEGGASAKAERWRLPLRMLAAASLIATVALVGLASHASALGETEPNDALASANSLPATGAYLVNGNASNATDPADFYEFNLTSAVVVEVIASSSWGCTGARCENLSVVAVNGSTLIDPFGDPMTGRDVYFSGLAGATWYLRVAAGSPGGAYSLSVQVYPFTYASGANADVTDANRSSAIVAFAVATPKSSVHPYDLAAEGDGVYYGYSLKLFVANVGPLDLSVEVPAGLTWRSEDRNYTDFVVTRDQFVTVQSWTYTTVLFVASAISPYGWVPGDPSRPNNDPTYYLAPMASGDLGKITSETNLGHYSYQAEQCAVWASEAGQNRNDLFNLGASDAARNEAILILDRANVHTAINPHPSSLFAWLATLPSWWPFCFAFFFFGFPLIFGISQAIRAASIHRTRIDGGYIANRERAESSRLERREFIREERRRERERRRARKVARAVGGAAAPGAPAPAPTAPVPTAISTLGTAHASFLAMDAMEHFDLDGLNELDFNSVLAGATATKPLAAETAKRSEQLLARIRQDVGDPDIIDDILRDRMVKWYRESAGTSDWSAWASHAWSGLVAESRTPAGGKRSPLDKRVSDLKEACEARGKWLKPKAKDPNEPPRKGRGAVAVPLDPAVVKEQVVQAVLDDMTAPKASATAHPLPVLSELAAKLSPQRVNTALAEMFKADPRGPYVVLHPSRYPDCDITVIRPPAQGAKAGAMAYEIFFAKGEAQANVPQQAQTGGFAPAGGTVPGLLDTSGALWARDSVGKEEWTAVLGELARERDRLEAPPPNYRKLPPYFTLRELLLSDEAARRAYLAVKWRGKPVALGLLAQLLLDKSLSPDIDTDREYFEAELGDLERGDTGYQPPAGTWTIGPGIVVTRSGDPEKGFTYKV